MSKTELGIALLGSLLLIAPIGCDDDPPGKKPLPARDGSAGSGGTGGSGGSGGAGARGGTGGTAGSGSSVDSGDGTGTGGSAGSGGSGGTAGSGGTPDANPDKAPDMPATPDVAADLPPDVAVDLSPDIPPAVTCESACPALFAVADDCEPDGTCTFATQPGTPTSTSNFCHINGVTTEVVTVEGNGDDYTQTVKVRKAATVCYTLDVHSSDGTNEDLTWKNPAGATIATGRRTPTTVTITCGGPTHNIGALECAGTFGPPDEADCTAGSCM
jgi:hypothetical protein